LALLAAAAGLVIASVIWRLPYIQRLEAPDMTLLGDDQPAPTHRPAPPVHDSA